MIDRTEHRISKQGSLLIPYRMRRNCKDIDYYIHRDDETGIICFIPIHAAENAEIKKMIATRDEKFVNTLIEWVKAGEKPKHKPK